MKALNEFIGSWSFIIYHAILLFITVFGVLKAHSMGYWSGYRKRIKDEAKQGRLINTKKYTIGALFTPDFRRVLLILKTKPKWQAGKFNLPGGSIEEGEDCFQCVAREFKEETNIDIPDKDWDYIGRIENQSNYYVDFLTSIYHEDIHGVTKKLTEEQPVWANTDALPDNVISNLHWLIPFAKNIHNQGNADSLTFGEFNYKYETA